MSVSLCWIVRFGVCIYTHQYYVIHSNSFIFYFFLLFFCAIEIVWVDNRRLGFVLVIENNANLFHSFDFSIARYMFFYKCIHICYMVHIHNYTLLQLRSVFEQLKRTFFFVCIWYINWIDGEKKPNFCLAAKNKSQPKCRLFSNRTLKFALELK